MTETDGLAPSSQWVQGDQNVQISHVSGSTIQITYEDRRWYGPLESAVVPVGAGASPAETVQASSGVIPYVDRAGLLTTLSDWSGSTVPFAVCVLGGRGGAGKSRLSVELCERATTNKWLAGMLQSHLEAAELKDLADTPTHRLVVIDSAENRVEQLEKVLPALKLAATDDNPIRVLLLVRTAPQRSDDWTESLRTTASNRLRVILSGTTTFDLNKKGPTTDERLALFHAAARAFAARNGSPAAPIKVAEPDLAGPTFDNALLIVITAYLTVQGGDESNFSSSTRDQLLEGLLEYEATHWSEHAQRLHPAPDPTLLRRIVAFATLAGTNASTEAAAEDEAARLLRSLPDLTNAPDERCHQLARWVHDLYRGPRWWNPLEPDLLAEHLIATTLTEFPDALTAVLDRSDAGNLVQPLIAYARTAANDTSFADAIRPVLTAHLERLCTIAATQAAQTTDLHGLLSGTTIANALDQAVSTIHPDHTVLPAALNVLPPRADVVLNGLALTLTEELVNAHRTPAREDAKDDPDLAGSLNNLSNRLSTVQRHDEAVTAIEDAVAILRRLAQASPAIYEPDLARSLNNLSSQLSDVRRHDEAVTAIEDAVAILRRLAQASPAIYEPDLAGFLGNLSNRLSDVRRHDEAVTAIEDAVTIYRQLAQASPAIYEPDLARSLNNLSSQLSDVRRHDEAVTAIEDAVAILRRLAQASPAIYEPDLAGFLGNLSNRLSDVRRHDEAVTAIEDAVTIYRQLAQASPATYEPRLAGSLNNLSNQLSTVQRHDEAVTAIEDAVAILRRLAQASPAIYDPDLAGSLNNLSNRLSTVQRHDEAVTAIEDAVTIYRQLAKENPVTYEPRLAGSLNNLSNRLSTVQRHDEAVTAIEDAVAICRQLAKESPATYEPHLARSLNNLSNQLSTVQRHDEAVTAIEDAVTIYRQLAKENPATYEPHLAGSLNNLSNQLSTVQRHDEAVTAIEDAVAICRQLAKESPATYEPHLARSLNNLSNQLSTVQRHDEAVVARQEAERLTRPFRTDDF